MTGKNFLERIKSSKFSAAPSEANSNRFNRKYGIDLEALKQRQSAGNYHLLYAEDWEDAYWQLVQYNALPNLDVDFDYEEDEQIAEELVEQSRLHFEEYGYVECDVYNSYSTVCVYAT